MKRVPTFWVSLITGKKYKYTEYVNHGKGGNYKGLEDLPKDEYPFTLEYNKKDEKSIDL